jgi:hypothetical protein
VFDASIKEQEPIEATAFGLSMRSNSQHAFSQQIRNPLMFGSSLNQNPLRNADGSAAIVAQGPSGRDGIRINASSCNYHYGRDGIRINASSCNYHYGRDGIRINASARNYDFEKQFFRAAVELRDRTCNESQVVTLQQEKKIARFLLYV